MLGNQADSAKGFDSKVEVTESYVTQHQTD